MDDRPSQAPRSPLVGERVGACRDLRVKLRATQSRVASRSSSTIRLALPATRPWTRRCCSLGPALVSELLGAGVGRRLNDISYTSTPGLTTPRRLLRFACKRRERAAQPSGWRRLRRVLGRDAAALSAQYLSECTRAEKLGARLSMHGFGCGCECGRGRCGRGRGHRLGRVGVWGRAWGWVWVLVRA